MIPRFVTLLGAATLSIACATQTTGSSADSMRSRQAEQAAPSRAASATSPPAPPSSSARRPPEPVDSPAPRDSSTAAPLPDGIEPGVPTVVDIPGDRPAHVVHGRPGTRRAIVYLHGVCGDVTAMHSWAETASHYGTLIALMGDDACDAPGRYRWSLYIAGIDQRIDRALDVIADARGGLLDTDELTVFGYSQGATRAAALAQRFPDKYPRVVIGGMPVEPRVSRVGRARVIAVVGGEREVTAHMRAGAEKLAAAGKRARFFLLPEAAHGQFGPEGPRVLDTAFQFLFERD